MAMLMHLLSASAAWLGNSVVRFVCSDCGAQADRPVDDIIDKHGEDCTLGQLIVGASCRRCGSPFIVAVPHDDGDDEED
jgi:DNA-directed RNA polymerase subunit RPC12/RpoP